MENSFLKDINSKLTEQIKNNKIVFEQEQEKAKQLFNDFKQHSLEQYEEAKENIQEHVNHFNTFSEELKEQLTKSPFDFNLFSKSLFEYNKKSFEIISNATKKQTEKLTNLNQKIHQFYNTTVSPIETPKEESSSSEKKEEVNVVKPVKKSVPRKTTKKSSSV